MKKHMYIVFITGLLVLGMGMPATAEDFTLIVPVRMYKMVQGVGKVKVFCEVVDAQGQRIGSNYKWSEKHVNYYPTGLEEDIVIKFNANQGKDPRKAVSYNCDLKILLSWVSDNPWQTPDPNSNSMFLKPKPGTPFKIRDSGPLYTKMQIQRPKKQLKMKYKKY